MRRVAKAATVTVSSTSSWRDTGVPMKKGQKVTGTHVSGSWTVDKGTPIWCRTQASEVGDACREVVDQLLEVNALYRLRAAQGVLGLRKKYGDTRLEAACARAITVGDPSYRTIKGILVAGTESDPEPETSGDAGAAAFLHGPQGLFGSVTPPDTPDGTRDDQVHGEDEVAAR
ncbi:hypothetical protein QF032_000032 [Streptomyces achromogenes]|nr:hypothetical protein [Streptomyces achromogenes]